MEMLKPSRPEEVARDTMLVELPRAQGGVKLVFRIRALSKGEWLVAYGDVATMFSEDEEIKKRRLTPDENRRLVDMARRLAEAAVIEPALCFDSVEPAKVYWDDLASENQDALTEAITIFSGYAKKPTVEGEKIANFPAEKPGDGPPRLEAVRHRAAAAP